MTQTLPRYAVDLKSNIRNLLFLWSEGRFHLWEDVDMMEANLRPLRLHHREDWKFVSTSRREVLGVLGT